MTKISLSSAAKLFQRLATGYRAGIDLRTLWQHETKAISPILSRNSKAIASQLDDGVVLASAMENCNGYFSPLVIAVVSAGEQGGRLEQSFERLAHHYDQLHRFRRTLLTAMMWPLFELGLSILVIGATILLMGWALSGSGRDGIDWFGWGWGTRAYFLLYVLTVMFFAAAIFTFILGINRNWFGDWPMAIARRIPVVGGVIQNLSLARMTWALSATLEAGIDVRDGLAYGFRATQNRYYTSCEANVVQRIDSGQPIHDSLVAQEKFPDEFLTFVQNGEISGELPETMQRLSNMYQERAENGLKVLGTLGFVATLLFIGMILIVAIIFLFNKLILETYSSIGV